MSQFMHSYLRQTGSVSRSFPGMIPDPGDSLAKVCEDNPWVIAALSCNCFSGNPNENHNSVLSIFCD